MRAKLGGRERSHLREFPFVKHLNLEVKREAEKEKRKVYIYLIVYFWFAFLLFLFPTHDLRFVVNMEAHYLKISLENEVC